jgi:hypothetical protein
LKRDTNTFSAWFCVYAITRPWTARSFS